MDKIVLATHNKNKKSEIEYLLKKLSKKTPPKLLCAADFKLTSPAETGEDFADNSQIKAQYVAKQTGLPALADDSGLCIYYLDGKPGLRSAELAEELSLDGQRDYQAAMRYILNQMEGCKESQRFAKLVCCLCLQIPSQSPLFFYGQIYGTIAKTISGNSGMGYDSIFNPLFFEKTFGEMTLEEKSSFPTNRALALKKLIKYFE